MPSIARITTNHDEVIVEQLIQDIARAGLDILPSAQRTRGVPAIDILVALSSAGTLTVLYQVLVKFLEKNKGREITIEINDRKVTLKGLSPPEEMNLLRKLVPDLMSPEPARRGSQDDSAAQGGHRESDGEVLSQ